MAVCTSCNRQIVPEGGVVSFPCPSCTKVEIWRCRRCRKTSNPYTCPNCGFTGP